MGAIEGSTEGQFEGIALGKNDGNSEGARLRKYGENMFVDMTIKNMLINCIIYENYVKLK